MLKKYLSVVILIVFTVNSYMFTASAETVLVSEDFGKYTDDISAPWSSLKTGCSIRDSFPVRDAKNGKYLRIAPLTAWQYRISRELNKAVRNNLIAIGFDIMLDGTSDGEFMNGGLCLTGPDGTDYGLVNINTSAGGGNFDAYISMSSAGLNGSKKTFNDGEWHSVSMFLDFGIRRLTYFLDNQYWCDTNIPDSLTVIKTIDIMSVAAKGYTADEPSPVAMGVDNLRISDIVYDDVLNMIKDGEPVPDYLTGCITYDVSSGNTGNIFFDKNVRFNIKMKNTRSSGRIKSRLEVYKESGELVKSDITENSVSAGGVVESTYSFVVPEYGMYLFRVSDEDGMFDRTVRFSVCNPPEDGIKNIRLGVDTDFDEGYRGKPGVNVPLIAKAGFGVVREAFAWRYLDEDKSGASFTQRHRDFVDLAGENNIGISALVSGGNTAYTDESPPKSDNAVTDFAKYCGQLAALLDGKAEYIEVWNEYMLKGFNTDNLPPEDYARLLIESCCEIKKANPRMKVSAFSLPGFSDTVQQGAVGGLSSKEWLRRVLTYLKEHGALNSFDAVSAHPYTETCMPDDGEIMKEKYDEMTDVLSEYGKGDVPIVATEVGWSTRNAFTNQNRQANALLRQAVLNEVHNMYEKMIIYVFQCYSHDMLEREANFGIINTFDGDCPNTARPAYAALCNYNRIMSGAKFKGIVSEDTDTVYKFENRSGDTTYVMWNKGGKSVLKLADNSAYGVLCDIYGNEKTVYSANGIYTIETDENTSYLTILKNQAAVMDIGNRYSENSDYKKLFVGTEKPYTIVCKVGGDSETDISARTDDNISVSLYCETEVAGGARLEAVSNKQDAEFVWEFKDENSGEFERTDNDKSCFVIDNAHTGGYIRVTAVAGGGTATSGEVYVKPVNEVFREWRSNLPMVEKAPDNLLFTCDGRTFSLIDYDKDKKQIFATVTSVVKGYCHDYYKGSAIQKLDKNDENSILHFVNTNDFKNAVIGDKLKNYIVISDWVTESGNADDLMANQQIDRCGVSLLSVTEYINNIDKIGYNIGSGAVGCFLRTPSNKEKDGRVVYIPNKKSIIQTEVSNNGKGLIYPRAVFRLDIDFLKEIHADVDSMGDDIRKIILDNFTPDEMAKNYSQNELLKIGYKLSDAKVSVTYCEGVLSAYTDLTDPDFQWQYSYEPERGFEDIKDGNGSRMIPKAYLRKDAYVRLKTVSGGKAYYSNAIKLTDFSGEYTYWFPVPGMTADSPQKYVFKESGADKSYVLLNTEKTGAENSFFVLRNDCADGADFGIDDIKDKLAAGDESLEIYAGSGMTGYLIPHAWDMDDFDYIKKTAESKVNMLSAEEYISYAHKIGYNIGKPWWLRTPYSNGSGDSYCCITGDGQSPQTMIKAARRSETLGFRPAFYISREYFTERRLDLSETGHAVTDVLKNNFTRDELENIYSESELDIIFGKAENFNDKIAADLKAPSEVFVFNNLKDIRPLTDKITVK